MAGSQLRGHGASLHQRALLEAARRGDRRAAEEVLRRYEPLVRALVARARLPCGCDREELAQEARLGVLAAIRAWQPDRGAFGAFAVRCARCRVIKALDRAGAGKHQVLSRALSLDHAACRSEEVAPWRPAIPGFALLDRVAAGRLDEPLAALLAREQIARAVDSLSVLSAKERAALTGHLNGKSHRQLADEQGSTSKAVALALRRARRKLAAREERAA